MTGNFNDNISHIHNHVRADNFLSSASFPLWVTKMCKLYTNSEYQNLDWK